MSDAYGDGWNGNVLTIGDATFELASGASGQGSIGACAIDGCTDATACNYDALANTDDGSCTVAEEGLSCDGNQLDCSGEVEANLSWIGDGYCDDGAWGQYLDCETFNYDGGDCGHCVDENATNYGSIADC